MSGARKRAPKVPPVAPVALVPEMQRVEPSPLVKLVAGNPDAVEALLAGLSNEHNAHAFAYGAMLNLADDLEILSDIDADPQVSHRPIRELFYGLSRRVRAIGAVEGAILKARAKVAP